MTFRGLEADELRAALVSMVLEWERRYGVGPNATTRLSEYDAAKLVGHSPESFGLDCAGSTAVTPGFDFRHNGLRYQVKACRPSGKPGSKIWHVPAVSNFDWDRLIWIEYDPGFRILEAWEWEVQAFQTAFHAVLKKLRPAMMRRGRPLYLDETRAKMVPKAPAQTAPQTLA